MEKIAPHTPHKILLIDDELRVLSAIERRLHQLDPDISVFTASRSAEGVRIIERQQVDAVISDLRMPGQDGSIILGRARRAQPEALRIVLSGQATTDLLLAAMPASHRYLEKPCTTNHLQGVLNLMARVEQVQLPHSLLKNLLALSSLPIDGVYGNFLRSSPHLHSSGDISACTVDLGLYLSLLRLGGTVYGDRFTPISLPTTLLDPLLTSHFVSPLSVAEEYLNALRLVSIKAKLLEHQLRKNLPDARFAFPIAARLYLGEYVLLSVTGGEPRFSSLVEQHRDSAGHIMSELWDLPGVLSQYAAAPYASVSRDEVDRFLPLSDLEQLSSTDLIAMLSEVVWSNHS